MVIEAYSGFNKKPNSTRQPSASGTQIDVRLKENCSVLNPIFIVNGYNLSHNYIKWGVRYYFIDDIVILSNSHAEYICRTDVLATYKSDIGGSSQYVTRSASSYDGDIVDMLYATECDITQTSNGAAQDPGWTRDINTGCFVLGIMGKNAGQNGGAVTYYAVKPSAVQAITNYLMDPQNLNVADISDELLECIFNPMQYIVSCLWFPFDLLLGNDQLKVGWWSITPPSGTCAEISDAVYTRNISFTIPKHPQAASRGNYLNMNPFSRYLLNAGPWGIMPIENSLLLDDNSLDCFMNVDLYTGSGRFSIVGSQSLTYVQEFVAQIGVPVQLGQNMLNQGALSNVASGASGFIGGLLSGNPAQMLGSGTAALVSAAELSQSVPSTAGSNGSINFNTQFNLIGMFYKVVNDDVTQHGRPLCQVKTISSLSGYILCENADLDSAASYIEKEQIISYLNSGFYYE